MGSQVVDYTFTIIEDGQVPLAGNFETFSFTPVIAVVALGLVLLLALAYALWFETHSSRVKALSGDVRGFNAKYFFHPFKLIRDEADIEYSLAEASLNR